VWCKESRRLGAPLHKARAFDVLLSHFFAAARRIQPGHFTDEDAWPRSVGMYCTFRDIGEKHPGAWNALDIKDVVDRLQADNFADELLRVLWAECPEECRDMGLPAPADRTPMTDGQKQVWDALDRRSLTGKEPSKKLDHTEDVIRQWVRELRSKGYDVPTKRGRGYYRVDAPPDDFAPARTS